MIDLFRVNSLLEDRNSGNYNSVIRSIIMDYIMSESNKSTRLKHICSYITDQLGIEIQIDLLNEIIDDSSVLVTEELDSDIYVSINADDYKHLLETTRTDSIQSIIENFLVGHQLDINKAEIIKRILFESIYYNLKDISSSKFHALLKSEFLVDYTQSDIDLFNAFLEWDNNSKNKEIYKLFVKSIEFGIVTSNRAASHLVKGIFKNKEYCLDTNIILRLLGVNGKERQVTIKKLIRSCKFQGIKFFYTVPTQKELTRVFDGNERNLSIAVNAEPITEKYIEDYDHTLNKSFLWHYLTLKKEKVIRTTESYFDFLRSDFRNFIHEYDIEYRDIDMSINHLDVAEYKQELLKYKKSQNVSYMDNAATVDAKNLLYVKSLSGNHIQPYTDIKSLYLTTDRTLHGINTWSKKFVTTRTILPTQLFLLHQTLSTDYIPQPEDFRTFSLFLKKRTTEFKFSEEELIKYVGEISEITRDEETAINLLKGFSDTKYECTSKSLSKNSSFKSIKSYAETNIDKIINKTKKGYLELNKIQSDYKSLLQSKVNKASSFAFYLDLIIRISFGLLLLIPSEFIIISALLISIELIYHFLADYFHFRKKYSYSFFRFLTSNSESKIILSSLPEEIRNTKILFNEFYTQ